MKSVAIILPIYNEEKFILELINNIKLEIKNIENFKFEIIAINDGSTDNSLKILNTIKGIKILSQKNSGKGRAVQRGIKFCKSDLILIQDADLEYHPSDYKNLLKPFIRKGRISVYGSRVKKIIIENKKKTFFKGRHSRQGYGPYFMNIFLKIIFSIFFKRTIYDLLTGYKVYEKKFFLKNKIKTCGFEADHEISAKLIKNGYEIIEVPIKYSPRTKEEGKKINCSDAFKAVLTIFRFRIFK
jgi:glycosyltransferase involved in cell wall biosynthesis